MTDSQPAGARREGLERQLRARSCQRREFGFFFRDNEEPLEDFYQVKQDLIHLLN